MYSLINGFINIITPVKIFNSKEYKVTQNEFLEESLFDEYDDNIYMENNKEKKDEPKGNKCMFKYPKSYNTLLLNKSREYYNKPNNIVNSYDISKNYSKYPKKIYYVNKINFNQVKGI